MWLVTTEGDLPDDNERREHFTSPDAWQDYWGRILELEIHGFTRTCEDAISYGRAWASSLTRGIEYMTVTIERTSIN